MKEGLAAVPSDRAAGALDRAAIAERACVTVPDRMLASRIVRRNDEIEWVQPPTAQFDDAADAPLVAQQLDYAGLNRSARWKYRLHAAKTGPCKIETVARRGSPVVDPALTRIFIARACRRVAHDAIA